MPDSRRRVGSCADPFNLSPITREKPTKRISREYQGFPQLTSEASPACSSLQGSCDTCACKLQGARSLSRGALLTRPWHWSHCRGNSRVPCSGWPAFGPGSVESLSRGVARLRLAANRLETLVGTRQLGLVLAWYWLGLGRLGDPA